MTYSKSTSLFELPQKLRPQDADRFEKRRPFLKNCVLSPKNGVSANAGAYGMEWVNNREPDRSWVTRALVFFIIVGSFKKKMLDPSPDTLNTSQTLFCCSMRYVAAYLLAVLGGQAVADVVLMMFVVACVTWPHTCLLCWEARP